MKPTDVIAAAIDPGVIMRACGQIPDRWQRDLLLSKDRQVLLNCCRQAGKSTVVAALALHTALYQQKSLTVIISPVQRQSTEVFHKILDAYNALNRPIRAQYETQLKIDLENGSRVICLPGKEETVRCYSPSLMIIDEASRVPDDIFRALRPSLAVSQGRLIALSTPYGQRGWFFNEWNDNAAPYRKVKVTWQECPRISAEFIAEEERALGRPWIEQEYLCLFTAIEGLVYPDFQQCYTDIEVLAALGKQVGGIDWGWRNPFAAIWGVLDNSDVLWINKERYLRETPLHEHAKELPRIMWYADPAGRVEIEEFRSANHTIRRGYNDIRLGIAALTARIRTGRLKVNNWNCPNLVAEAKLYRYPDPQQRIALGENPIDEHNHALAALRYLVSRLDSRFIARLRRTQQKPEGPAETEDLESGARLQNSPRKPPKYPDEGHNDDHLWRKL
jgi:hypothetical protein